MTLTEIQDAYQEFREVSRGTLANAGSALATEGLISRDGRNGWEIAKAARTAVLSDGYLWGEPSLFGKSETAWFRREAIKDLLRTQGGLQQMQIVDRLQAMTWVYGSKEKDTVKMDLEVMRQEGAIHRVSHSRKWVLKSVEVAS